jgi:hypothetical protein
MVPELSVVAQVRVKVQRQVIGDQVDVGSQEPSQAPSSRPCNPGVLPAPEVAVMHQKGLRAFGHRLLDRRKAGGDGEYRP